MPRGGRAFAQLVLLFLVAVLVGRLLLEPTGVGAVVLAFTAPVLFAVLAALNGWRGALVLLGAFLALALLARLLFAASDRAWVLLLLLPVVASTLAVAASVARQMRGARGTGPRRAEESKEEEGEAKAS